MAVTFTYDSGNPGSTPLARLRRLVGDIGPDWLLTDVEITSQYDLSGGLYSAATALCLELAARFGTQVSSTLAVVGISEQTSHIHDHFMALAARYATMATVAGESGAGGGASSAVIATPFVGGVNAGEMNDVDTDTDRPRPAFSSTERCPLPYSTWRP